MAKTKSDFGRLYRGREGQWAWIMHRVTGVGIILFLFAHVLDTAAIGWGRKAYERVLSVYHNPFVQLLELALVAMVIYHALNGVRIMLLDFWPKASLIQARLWYATMALFVGSMIPITWIIGRAILRDL
jgi:succinate dehydrogenase / fumarate reductase, cytochrome b subunit